MIRAYEANQVENEELRRKFSTLEREYELLKEASESERTNFRENTMIKQSQQIQALKEEVERLGGLRHKLEDDQQSLKDYHDQAMADVKTKIANLTQALADKNERLRGVVEERDRALHKLERHRETVATARELIKANEGVLHAADNFRKTIED
jgi:chromosome segregation ATPase